MYQSRVVGEGRRCDGLFRNIRNSQETRTSPVIVGDGLESSTQSDDAIDAGCYRS